jgi:hypothetical protein
VVIDCSKDFASIIFTSKMKAAGFSEMYVITNSNTRCHNPEDLTNSIKLGPSWKPPVAHLVKNIPIFYGNTNSLSRSQEPTTCFYPGPD